MADPTNRMTAADPAVPASAPDAVPAATTPAPGMTPTPAPGTADLGRRRFFRQFAGDLANTAATMIGAAQALQQTSAELAGAILDPTRAALGDAAPGTAGPDGPAAAPVFRTSFRVEGGRIRFVDQRELPGAVVEHPSASAAEVTWAIRHDVVIGGPAISQAAALGLALTADRVRATRPYARRATLRGAANALTNAAPAQASVRWAVERVMAAYATVGELAEDGDAVAEAMHAEAERIIAEAAVDHGRLVDAGLVALEEAVGRTRVAADAGTADGPATLAGLATPLRVLVHGPSGALAGGQFGTALAIAVAAHHAERQVRVVVPEGRPGFVGARITCWELAAAGVPHLLVADAAGPSLIAAGEVDAILVPADRVAANGDVAATIGTYPLAVVAARHGVPFLVCAPLSAIDPTTATGSDITMATRPGSELEMVGGATIAPRATAVHVPTHDVTPAELVTGYITAGGLRRPPFEATAPLIAEPIEPAAPPVPPAVPA